MKQVSKVIKNGVTYYFADSALTQSVDNIVDTLNNLSIPDSTSDLVNDSGFLDSSDFKTINNQSIVGSGNITIQGGDGVSVSSITQAEYDDLPSSAKTDDIIWIITDVNPSGGSYTAGTNIDITNNVISVTGMPTDVSDLYNDSGYLTSTDFKTINNQSIVGSGNIDIQGGGVTVSSITQSQYDNLPSSAKTDDVIWIITDVNPSGGDAYSAGTNIDITNNVISVTGITVPTAMSQLSNDSGYLTKTSADTIYATQADLASVSGDIPTSTSELTNDSNYVASTNLKTINNSSLVGSGNIVVPTFSYDSTTQTLNITTS